MSRLPREPFATARLLADPLAPRHFPEIYRLHSDPRVMQTLSADGHVMPQEATRQQLQRCTDHWQQKGYGLWLFRGKSDGQFIGRGGLMSYSIEGCEVIGLAYAVLSEFWGQGFATEMAEASLRIGFDELRRADIASWTLPGNLASQRVMKKLGFQYERDFMFAGLRHVLYRLAAADWRRRGRETPPEPSS